MLCSLRVRTFCPGFSSSDNTVFLKKHIIDTSSYTPVRPALFIVRFHSTTLVALFVPHLLTFSNTLSSYMYGSTKPSVFILRFLSNTLQLCVTILLIINSAQFLSVQFHEVSSLYIYVQFYHVFLANLNLFHRYFNHKLCSVIWMLTLFPCTYISVPGRSNGQGHLVNISLRYSLMTLWSTQSQVIPRLSQSLSESLIKKHLLTSAIPDRKLTLNLHIYLMYHRHTSWSTELRPCICIEYWNMHI